MAGAATVFATIPRWNELGAVRGSGDRIVEGLPALMSAFVALELITGPRRIPYRRSASLHGAMLLAPFIAATLSSALAFLGFRLPADATPVLVAPPLGPIGEAIGGYWGQITLLALAVGALLLTLNLTFSLVVRHLFAMSRDGFLPGWLGQADDRRRGPVVMTAVAALAGLPLVWLPDTVLSRTAGLLYTAVLMSVNVALARQPRARLSVKARRVPFLLPAHPWVPLVVVAVDVLALSLWGWRATTYALGLLAGGGLIYLLYGRHRHEQAQAGVTVFRTGGEVRSPGGHSILVPIANPATAGSLLQFASRLAETQGGEVIALRVEIVPEPLPLERGRHRGKAGHELLDRVMVMASDEGWPIRTLTRVARTIPEGIVSAAADEHVDLIVAGWRGPKRARETSMGSVINGVLRDSPCAVLVLRGEDVSLPRRVLVPSAGGSHAREAARLALALTAATDGQVTLLSVHSGPATDEQLDQRRRQLEDTVAGLDAPVPLQHKVVRAPSPADGIVREAGEHDLVLMGVSEESLLDRLVFGSVPLQVANRVPATALVQAGRGVTGVWTRRLVRALSNAFPVLSQREQTVLRQELVRGARPGTNYLVLAVLSSVIAALGLLLNSPAVVIGAMLIAPLMSPLMAFALGLVLGDLRLIRLSIGSIIKGIALALLIAAFLGLLSPLKGLTDEMIARSRPNLLDLVVALASGLAGAYALSRKDVGTALPGVALAASLMPPLATVGLALAMGQPQAAGGALLLFAANIAAISLAAGLVFLLLGLRPQTWAPDSRRQLRRRLLASFVTLIALAVPLGLIFSGIVRDARRERTSEAVLGAYLSDIEADLVDLNADEAGGDLHVVVTIRSEGPIGVEWVNVVAAALAEALGEDVQLDVVPLPVVQSNSR
jgi:uncharacterized hydrophobic protein (TIGR00271 family)